MPSPFGNRAKEKVWYIVGGCLAIPGLTLWLLSTIFYSTASRQREPTQGKIYPLNMHGTVVYQTKLQKNEMNFCEVAGMGLMAVAGVITAYSKKRYQTTQVEVSPRKKTYLLANELEEQEKRRNVH